MAHYVSFNNKVEHGTNTQNVRQVLFDNTLEFKYMLNIIIIFTLCIMVLGPHVFSRAEI